jgi:hypothetical protein
MTAPQAVQPTARPAPPPLFGDRWPGPSAPPSRLVLGAIAAGGLTVATAMPLRAAGLGWLVIALVLAGALAAVGRRSLRWTDAAWLVGAVALAGVSVVRDAPWLVALCLMAACGAGALAVAGRSFRSAVVTGLAVAIAALRGLPWMIKGVRRARDGAGRNDLRIAVSALVGVGLLLVFGSLLAGADAAFARVVGDLLPSIDDESATRWIVLFPLGAMTVLGASFLLVAPPPPTQPPAARPVRAIEWALPAGMLVALFALFVGVQFATLFGSDDYVMQTTGLTYAEYARGGFWQLLWVTVLALGVIALGLRLAPAGSAIERAWKRGLLGALTCLTLVIVASALNRMVLYQQAYGFTELRVLVLTCELWLGACFVLVLAAVLRLRASAPTRAMLAAGVVALLGLAVVNPDRLIAEQNIARGKVDGYYLSTLSADAVPVLIQHGCLVAPIATGLREPDDWRSWNLSREQARAALAATPVGC